LETCLLKLGLLPELKQVDWGYTVLIGCRGEIGFETGFCCSEKQHFISAKLLLSETLKK
jgi:hypothetical protein